MRKAQSVTEHMSLMAKLVHEREDEEMQIRKDKGLLENEKIKVIEMDYLENDEHDRITLRDDIYQVAIAAVLSRDIDPYWEGLAIKHAFFSYFLQLMTLQGLFYDFSSLDDIQPLDLGPQYLRVVATMILQEQIFIELQDVVKLMECLRRLKGDKPEIQRARIIGILLCFMQKSALLFAMFVLISVQM